jgi:predicted amidohydrolase
MPRIVTVAATQMACSWDTAANLANAERLVRQAAAKGAQIILIQELFETPYLSETQPGLPATGHPDREQPSDPALPENRQGTAGGTADKLLRASRPRAL